MSRAGWLNALLATAVAALGAFVYFKPAKDAPVEYALSALKAEEVRTIRIERDGAAAIALEKRDDAWRLTAPFAARADPTRVQRLLAIAGARAAHRFPATDLARFDLERPATRVILDAQSFGFGLVRAESRELYVLTGGAVYTVSASHRSALPANAAELASRHLFGPDESFVRMRLKDFSVASRDGRWVLSPDKGELSQDDFNRWVDEWRLATALRVETYAKSGFQGQIGIELTGGGGLTLGIVSREPELVLARPDEKLQYHFFGEIGKRLLSPPGTRQEKP